MSLAGKIAIVTGGSRGIGLGIANCLIAKGAHVVCTSRSEPDEDLGPRLEWRRCDVSVTDEVEILISGVVSEHGRLDIVVNNAGVQIEKTVIETSDTDWQRLTGTNMHGVFLMCRAAIPEMVRSGGGVIINIGSISATAADPGLALYNASKAFVQGLTRSIAVDHGPQGIRCNAISPGWIETGMADQAFALAKNPDAARKDALARHAVGRLGRPDDIGHLAAWLCSDEAAFITGQCFTADGGLTAASPLNPAFF